MLQTKQTWSGLREMTRMKTNAINTVPNTQYKTKQTRTIHLLLLLSSLVLLFIY